MNLIKHSARAISAVGEHLSVVLAKFVQNMRRNRYILSFGQTSDITIRFSDSDFLKN